jgi:hypothetical protein
VPFWHIPRHPPHCHQSPSCSYTLHCRRRAAPLIARRSPWFLWTGPFLAGCWGGELRQRVVGFRCRRWMALGVGSFFNPDIEPQQIDLTPMQTQQDIADRDSRRAQSKAVGKARLQSIEQEQAERRATERRRAAASEAESRSLASEVNRRGKIQDQRIRQQ